MVVHPDFKVVALAGGIGGARLAAGLAQLLEPDRLNIIVNTGDDFEYWGLHISPDIDTVMYTLAGQVNPETGLGLQRDTQNCLSEMRSLSQKDWYQIGDRELATHLIRTKRLREGFYLTEVTRYLCQQMGIQHRILPMTDGPFRTIVETDEGEMDFQTYSIVRKWQPVLKGIRWQTGDRSKPNPLVVQALQSADLVVVCPSNPFYSIDPILNVPGVEKWVHDKPAIAVSPIIAGQALKGPAAKIFPELTEMPPSAFNVARYYQRRHLLDGFVFDHVDSAEETNIEALGLAVLVTDTVMQSFSDQKRLAEEVLTFGSRLV